MTSSNPFSISVVSDTPLAQVAAALAPGEDNISEGIAFEPEWTGSDVPTGDDFNWINKFHYDHSRGMAYQAAKIQNANTAMTHAWYLAATNVWLSVNCGFDAPGHVFDFIAYDHDLGHGYVGPGGGRSERLFRSEWSAGRSLDAPAALSKDAWTEIASIMYGGADNFVSGSSACDYHPNLFGPGDGGIVIVCQRGIAAWRKATDTYSVIVDYGALGLGSPTCVYSRGLDACIVALNDETRRVYRVDSASSATTIESSPIAFAPDRGGEDVAALVDDPNLGPTVYAFEKISPFRVWKYADGSWALQAGKTHPFRGEGSPPEDFMLAACYGLGVFWALEGMLVGTARSRIWKPDC